LYHRFRRRVIEAYLSQKFGNGILNVGSGKRNYALLVDEDIVFEVLDWSRP
jgi:hypothetical protein